VPAAGASEREEAFVKIAYLAAGAAGMYCGACHRDLVLIRRLLARGHEVETLPLYTPLRADDEIPPTTRVFYGGVSCYLAQLGGIGRLTARALDGLLSSRPVLGLASKFAVSTDPASLGPLTVSVLSGKDGRQADALKQLLTHLRTHRPQLVCLTNSLLSGIAPGIKSELGLPVVCSLQGEEEFISGLPEPYAGQASEWLRRNATSIDLFLATSASAAKKMAGLLAVDPTRIRVVRPGLDPERHPISEQRPREPFVIGYLSVIVPRKGLHVLLDAWRILTHEQRRPVILRVAGQVLDKSYWNELQSRTGGGGAGRFEYLGEVDRAGKLAFFNASSVFVLPSVNEEARGLAAMEAMACGRPVVLPNTGVFPELIASTDGGLLVPPRDAKALAEALAQLMDQPVRADELGRNAAAGIRKTFTADTMADGVEVVFKELVKHAGDSGRQREG
jgi:glycosyltransferase involved in cell wall biosynthesis